MLTFYEKYQDKGKYSQNGEWGIIKECIRRINPKNKVAVEFGAPSFYYCSNVAQLEDDRWYIRMYDINENVDARVKQVTITPENVNDVIGGCTVLSIDVDNDDYWIWKAYEFKPDIVIIEINSSIPPTVEEIPGLKGASYLSMTKLGIEKGYFLLVHTGNLIFIREDYRQLFPDVSGDGIFNYEEYFNKSFL